jgi:amino acid permease
MPDYCTTQNNFNAVNGILNFFSCSIISYVVPMLFALAVAAFIWGVIQTLLNPSNEEARKKGKSFMLWGIISLFVMLSVWGLVSILASTFGKTTVIPQVSYLYLKAISMV